VARKQDADYEALVGRMSDDVLALGSLLVRMDRVRAGTLAGRTLQEQVAEQLRKVCASAKAVAERAGL
jgi:hypothetical protein